MNKIYWSSIEYHYRNSSTSSNKLKGGFVYVFLNTFDVQSALKKIYLEMDLLDIVPIDIEFISLYDIETEWDTAEQTAKVKLICTNEIQTSDIVFDTFHAYESE